MPYTTRDKVNERAEQLGWTVQTKRLPFGWGAVYRKGDRVITVRYNAHGAIASANGGPSGQYAIAGRGKFDKLVTIMQRWGEQV